MAKRIDAQEIFELTIDGILEWDKYDSKSDSDWALWESGSAISLYTGQDCTDPEYTYTERSRAKAKKLVDAWLQMRQEAVAA